MATMFQRMKQHYDFTSCMGVFLPAVGEGRALATLGGELGPESGLLLEVSTGKEQSIGQLTDTIYNDKQRRKQTQHLNLAV
jgi:hypothetical protein